MTKNLEESITQKDSITSELKSLLGDYEFMKSNNDSLNAQLVAEQEKIKTMLEDIKNIKANNRWEIRKYKKELKTLRKIMRNYVVQIDSLNTLNQNLTAENRKIKTTYSKTRKEKEKLAEENKSLSVTVAKASTIKAINIETTGLNHNNKKTRKAKKVKKFKVCFVLEENEFAPKGEKEIFIRIAKPDGEILATSKDNTFVLENDETVVFSSKRTIQYDGTNIEGCVYYKTRDKLESGTYTVDIFNNGQNIGTSVVKIK